VSKCDLRRLPLAEFGGVEGNREGEKKGTKGGKEGA